MKTFGVTDNTYLAPQKGWGRTDGRHFGWKNVHKIRVTSSMGEQSFIKE